MTYDTFHDLETRSPVPIKNGTHAYAEKAEVMLWAYAGPEGETRVWDLMSGSDWYLEELSGEWREIDVGLGKIPPTLAAMLNDPEALVWFHNGGMFDFVVLLTWNPAFGALIPIERWRDTMILAYLHSLPGALDKLGLMLEFDEGDRKLTDGRRLIRLFCIPYDTAPDGTPLYHDRQSHPVEWKQFVIYAARDIRTMRTVRNRLPRWNDTPKQWALWQCDLRINYRGFHVDQELADAAILVAESAKRSMASRVSEITDGDVGAATQRDKMLKWILESHGVELPDMRADTLERRMDDPELPSEVKELLGLRLRSSMNSPAKFKAVKKAVSRDSRLRGTQQFRGAGRTGRTAHRLFQPGNMMRPTMPWPMIQACITGIKRGTLDLIWDNPMEACSNTVRSVIDAPHGKKLVVADLANVEGRYGAWLPGEETTLQAFRDYDTLQLDANGEPIPNPKKPGEFLRVGPDLYVKAYCASFNVEKLSDDKHEAFLQRQIGKVEELMFLYGGGVGAWITGAATYGIDLDAMTEAVYDTLPGDVIAEAAQYLSYLYEELDAKYRKALDKLTVSRVEGYAGKRAALDAQLELDKEKARYGLSEKVFITCDSIKRLWRRARPRTVSYWKELESTIREAIENPGVTLRARRVRVRRSGDWLRIALPSGRELCYPNIRINKAGKIAYTGQNQYTKKWEELTSYGGKFFENLVQAAANDQLVECLPIAEAEGYSVILTVHDEDVAEVPDLPEYSAQRLAEIMVSDLGWNRGVPLAAAGDSMKQYHKV